jgi:hypothetical protein
MKRAEATLLQNLTALRIDPTQFALRHKQTFRNAEAMSALPPIGHRLRFPDVSFGQ